MRARSRAHAQHIALALGLIALAAALIGALGPGTKEQATYSWPPERLPAAKPERQWYAPLLLIRRSPATMDVSVPCRGARPLSAASEPLTLIATARRPAESGGLAITGSEGRVDFAVGGDTFATVDTRSISAEGSCPIRLQFERDRWSIRGPGGVREGDLDGRTPIVSGFFSAVDLAAGSQPSIDVTTEPFGRAPAARQKVAWILAALLALTVFASIAGPGRRGIRRSEVVAAAGRVGRSARPVDLFVALLLVVWWVLAPVLYDDGWVKVRQTNYGVSGGFSNYYSSYGVNLPLDHWLEWMQHWVVAHSDTLLVLRLPALVLLSGTWILCRWTLSRVASGSPSPMRGALWVLGVAFVFGALAWDMTLRPEPVVALLAVGSLACAVRFVERASAVPLIIGAVIVVLGVTAHPAGLITVAPLLVVSPRIVRWARATGWLVPVAIAASVLALALVLASVGSDLFQRAADARGIRDYGDAVRSWRDELNRYLLEGGGASPMRRGSVALMLAAVVAYLVRRSRALRPLLDLPAAGLALALVLMVPTPSKWIWHFGVFAGLAAVAVAAEFIRLREQASNRWALTPFVAAGVAVLVAGWAWFPRIEWGDFDLRTLDWTIGLEDRVTAVRASAAVVIAGMIVVLLVELVRRGWTQRGRVTWSILPWLVPLAVLPVVGFTVVMLALDTAKTPAWTVGRQNLESLRGDSGCALAEDTTVAAPSSFDPLPAVASQRPEAVGPWTPSSPVPGLQRFSLFADGGSNTLTTPWYRVPQAPGRVGFFVSSVIGGAEVVEARWGRRDAEEVSALSGDVVQARTLPPKSCYEAGARGRLPDGRRTFHLRRIDGAARDGWAIEGAGYVTEAEFNRLWAGAALAPAAQGPGFDPSTLPTCEPRSSRETSVSSPSSAGSRFDASNDVRGFPVTVPASETERPETVRWTFIPEARLPPRPPGANLVQFALRSESNPPRAFAVTGAVSYRNTSLEELIAASDSRPLVWPNLVLYMPCRRLPRLEHGIVEVPTVLVSRSGLWPIELETSPFHSVLDLYTLRDLSVGDSEVEPEGMHVYWVDRDIPGTALAPAERTPVT